jgi:hypothetical protein
MLGTDWRQADPPDISRELLAMASFPQAPESVLWYSGQPGSYIACARFRSIDTCRYAAHAFNQLPEHGGRNWSYLSGPVKQQECVPPSTGGT